MWVVHLVSAVICLHSQCYPALVGNKTPLGDFTMVHMRTSTPGYGGDVLGFASDDSGVFAVHRVWTLRPKQHRLERLKASDPVERETVTDGCVNVSPEVYELILDSGDRRLEVVRD